MSAVTVDLMQTPRLHYLGDFDQHESYEESDRRAPEIQWVHGPPEASWKPSTRQNTSLFAPLSMH